MAAALDIRACVNNITKCSICLENFDQPKSLPCLHTFCLKCLKGLCQDMRPGQRKACPMCRKQFRIPERGVEGLPLNFDMVALLEAHRGIEYCDRHTDEALKLYCFDCDRDICILCFTLTHPQHRCEDAKTAAERFCQQIDEDVERVFARVDEVRGAVKQLDNEQGRYREEMEKLRAVVRHHGDTIKQFIDDQVNRLLERVEILKNGILGDIERHKERLEMSLAAMESFKSYSQEIKTKSRVRSVAKVASDLHDRVDDLLHSSVSLRQYHAPAVDFIPTDFLHLSRAAGIEQNVIGKLSDGAFTADVPVPSVFGNDTESSSPVRSTSRNAGARLRHTFPAGKTIRGLTVLGSELYVLRMPANNEIQVFNVDHYGLQRHLTVPHLRDAVDLTSCSRLVCLYVADDTSCCIRRIDARGSAGVLCEWTSGEKPSGLSVRDGHVLVTCRDSGQLKLFTADGQLLQQVQLEADVVRPCHSVQLGHSRFVVVHGSHSDHLHRVCVVDSDGHLLNSHGGLRGEAAGQLDFPRHLAVVGDREVLVADFNNRRVIRLTSSLDLVDEISAASDICPYRLCVDQRRRTLYVGGLMPDNDSSRLAVFDI